MCSSTCACASASVLVCVCASLWQILPQCLPQVGRLAHALSVACNEIVFPLAKCTLSLSVCMAACMCLCECVFIGVCVCV